MNRILSLMAALAVVLTGSLAGAGVCDGAVGRSDVGTGTIRVHSGSPYLADFMALVNKRSDLRMSFTHKGVDAAFSDWLRAERPLAYKEALARNQKLASSSCSPGCKEKRCNGSACCSEKGGRCTAGKGSGCNGGCKGDCCGEVACDTSNLPPAVSAPSRHSCCA